MEETGMQLPGIPWSGVLPFHPSSAWSPFSINFLTVFQYGLAHGRDWDAVAWHSLVWSFAISSIICLVSFFHRLALGEQYENLHLQKFRVWRN
jgi:hypothetical protein